MKRCRVLIIWSFLYSRKTTPFLYMPIFLYMPPSPGSSRPLSVLYRSRIILMHMLIGPLIFFFHFSFLLEGFVFGFVWSVNPAWSFIPMLGYGIVKCAAFFRCWLFNLSFAFSPVLLNQLEQMWQMERGVGNGGIWQRLRTGDPETSCEYKRYGRRKKI